MTTNTLVNENLTNSNDTTASVTSHHDGPIAHLDHMLSSLHDEQRATRMPSNIPLDAYDNKLNRLNHRSTPRTAITDGKIVECSSENSIVYRYYTGESESVIDEHFDKALKQPVSLNSARSIPSRDPRTSSYGYSSMMNPSGTFWPNFMASPTSYPHPTYLPTSPNEYSDWMHHHHTYRSPYSANAAATSTATTPSSSSSSNISNNHLHPIGSPNNTNNNNSNNNNNNAGRYHHHTPADMDVVTAAAIGAAAAAQMFHHEKQSHHGYTPASHHFDYHLGGSMMATASYAFPTQSFDLMGASASSIGLDNSNMKDSTTSPPWYSNHHLSC